MPSHEDVERLIAERNEATASRDVWRTRAIDAERTRDKVAQSAASHTQMYLAVVELMERWLHGSGPEVGRHYGEALRAVLQRVGRESRVREALETPEATPVLTALQRQVLAVIAEAARDARDNYVLSGLAEHDAMSRGWERFSDALLHAITVDEAVEPTHG
jgi:hypothetical protein